MELFCSVAVSSAVHCLYNLQVSMCRLTARAGPKDQQVALLKGHDLNEVTKYPVLFSLNDGELGSVYAVPADTILSLNIKRGIISGFGISKSSADGREKMHRDIHGTCPRKVVPYGSRYKISKRMTFCKHPSHPDWNLSPWSLFWNMNFIQPFMDSSTNCEYVVNKEQNQLEKVSCNESHAMKGIRLDFSQDTSNAVQTDIKYLLAFESLGGKMHFKYQENELRTTGIELEYETTSELQSQPSDFLTKAQKALSDLLLMSEDAIELRAVPAFNEFVDILRTAIDVVPFVKTVISCHFIEGVQQCSKLQKELGLDYLKDALIQCNTGACLGGFRQLVVQDQVSQLYLTGTLLSLAYIPIKNPAYIDELLAICKHTEMKTCWLVLGTAIHKYSEEHHDIPQSLKDTLAHLSLYIKNQCNVEELKFPDRYRGIDRHEYLITMMKTIGNIGEVVRTQPGLIEELLACAARKNAPQEISVAAIKALERIRPGDDVYKKLILILKDEGYHIPLRLASYDILVKKFQDTKLAKEIVSLLRTERSAKVKCFIVTDIQRMKGELEEKDSQRFGHKLLEELRKANVHVKDFRCNAFFHSSSYSSSFFFNLPFIPDEMKRFGLELDGKTVFDNPSAYPYSVTRNLTIQLFSKLLNILETGISVKNWEQVGIWLRRQFGDRDFHLRQWLEQNYLKIMKQLDVRSVGEREMMFVYPNKMIAENLKKIIKTLLKSHETGKPSLEAYIKTFGNELGYFTSDGLFSLLAKQRQRMTFKNLKEKFKKGIIYNATRAFKLIEAYYHVPTLMGLPVTLQTNCTYITSPRLTVGAQSSTGERSQNVYAQYSEALRLQNAMVLELPHVTQVGVQMTTDQSSSFDANLQLLDSKEPRIIYKPSSRRQKYVEFYHTNHQIQHNEVVQIPDMAVQKKEVKQCTVEKFGKVTGFKLCYELMYPKLPFNMITSTFIAGATKAKVYAEMVDRKLHEYELRIKYKKFEKGSFELKLNFSAPGNYYKRDAQVYLKLDVPKSTGHFEVSAPEFSDVSVKAQHKTVFNKDEVLTGLFHSWAMQLQKDKPYQMELQYDEKPLSRAEVIAGHGSVTQQGRILLRTPYNIYRFNSELYKNRTGAKADALLKYENFKKEGKWPAKFLPKSLWETDEKASVQLTVEWMAMNDQQSPDSTIHRTVNFLNTPKRSVKLVTYRIKNPSHVILQVNATAADKVTQKILSHANFSYHWQRESDVKDIRDMSLKIPHYTWNVHAQKIAGKYERTVTVKLQQKRQIPTTEKQNEEEKQRTHGTEVVWAANYRGSVKATRLEKQLLPKALEQLEGVNINMDQQYSGYKITVDSVFMFPVEGKEESITFNGTSRFLYDDISKLPRPPKTVADVEQWLDVRGTESVWTFYNSFSQDKAKIYKVTAGRQDWVKRWILYRNQISLANGEKIEHFLNFLWGEKEECKFIKLKHKFLSSFYSFDSDALLECKSKDVAHMDLHIGTESKLWDMLQSSFNQTLDFERGKRHSGVMDFTSRAFDIHTTFTLKKGPKRFPYFYDMEGILKSKTDLLPKVFFKAKLNVTTITSAHGSLLVAVPDEGIEMAELEIDVARDGFTLTEHHIHTALPNEKHQHFGFGLKLLTPYQYHINGYLSWVHTQAAIKQLRKKMELLQQKIEIIRKNENSPLNKLKRAIHKLIEKEKQYLKRALGDPRRDLKEIRRVLYPFFEPTVQMISNVRTRVKALYQQIREKYRLHKLPDHIDKNEVMRYAKEIFEKVQKRLLDLLEQYANVDYDNKSVSFSYSGSSELYMKSLQQAFGGRWRRPLAHLISYIINGVFLRNHFLIPPHYRTAMIFGPHHVYTFDGRMYEFPDYPTTNCTYLLLHDIRYHSFSVMVSSLKVFLLFPEMTITIDLEGKIYVNNSLTQTQVPLESDNGLVTIVREGKIIVVETVGLKVLCDTSRMFCIFALDPFLHSGTAGLLGNADGEEFNDLMLPDGTIVGTVAEMARAYEVTDGKKCISIHEKQKLQWSKEVQRLCSVSFGNQYFSCINYTDIDEDLFREACYWDVHQKQNVCASPDALAGYCTVSGVKTEPCSPSLKWNQKTVKPAKKLEVILVIDHYFKMFSEGLVGLEKLIQAVQKEFESKGYKSILFSVIGFGGEGIFYQPHIQTPDKEMWHTHKDTIDFLHKNLHFDGQHRGDMLAAVEYATTVLPFDMQSSRIMLLFTVDDVNNIFSILRVLYLEQLLDSYGITLYSFADFPFIGNAFGVRADGSALSSNDNSYMEIPSEFLSEAAALAVRTNGAVFQIQLIEKGAPINFEVATKEFRAKVEKDISRCRRCIKKITPWWDIQHQCELADKCDQKRKKVKINGL